MLLSADAVKRDTYSQSVLLPSKISLHLQYSHMHCKPSIIRINQICLFLIISYHSLDITGHFQNRYCFHHLVSIFGCLIFILYTFPKWQNFAVRLLCKSVQYSCHQSEHPGFHHSADPMPSQLGYYPVPEKHRNLQCPGVVPTDLLICLHPFSVHPGFCFTTRNVLSTFSDNAS